MIRRTMILLLALSFAAIAPGADSKKSDEAAQEGEVVKTPFGNVVKKPAAAPAREASKQPTGVTVEVDGDKLHFARRTPFGYQRWTRNRDELSDFEKRVLAEHDEAQDKEEKKESEKADSSAKR